MKLHCEKLKFLKALLIMIHVPSWLNTITITNKIYMSLYPVIAIGFVFQLLYILIYPLLGYQVMTGQSDFCLSSAMFQLIQKTGNYNVCKLNSRRRLVHSWSILRIFLCFCWPKLSFITTTTFHQIWKKYESLLRFIVKEEGQQNARLAQLCQSHFCLTLK